MKVKQNNGWYHIKDKQPKNHQEVYVIFESGSSTNGSYHCGFGKSTYHNGHFGGEDCMFRIRYWRETFTYPSDIDENKKESRKVKNNMKDLLGKEVIIDDKEGEISNVLDCGYEVTFYDINFGKTYIDVKKIENFLKENKNGIYTNKET